MLSGSSVPKHSIFAMQYRGAALNTPRATLGAVGLAVKVLSSNGNISMCFGGL